MTEEFLEFLYGHEKHEEFKRDIDKDDYVKELERENSEFKEMQKSNGEQAREIHGLLGIDYDNDDKRLYLMSLTRKELIRLKFAIRDISKKNLILDKWEKDDNLKKIPVEDREHFKILRMEAENEFVPFLQRIDGMLGVLHPIRDDFLLCLKELEKKKYNVDDIDETTPKDLEFFLFRDVKKFFGGDE